MSFKELYALCVALMCDDHPSKPVMTMVAREVLVEFADRQARRHGFQDWQDFYQRIDNPLPLISIKEIEV